MFKSTILAVAMLVGAASFVEAAPIRFTFDGTITYFDAFSPVAPHSLPALASPGDFFTGIAWFDSDSSSMGAVGFALDFNGQHMGGGDWFGGPVPDFLTPTELYIGISSPTFGGPYSTTSTGRGYTNLSLLFASGTGFFSYDGDNLNGTVVVAGGTINSVRAVPDTMSSLWFALPAVLLFRLRHSRA